MGQDWTEDGVRMERTNWRDSEISERHRQWGFNCPGVDLDFVMLEYNHGVPVAVIEYKHKNAREPKMDHPTYNALRHLADNHAGGALPYAHALTPSATGEEVECCVLSEQRFVRSLYYMRGVKLSENDKAVISRLNDTVPGREAA